MIVFDDTKREFYIENPHQPIIQIAKETYCFVCDSLLAGWVVCDHSKEGRRYNINEQD